MISLSGQKFKKELKVCYTWAYDCKEQDWQMSKTFQFFYKTK